MIEKAIDTPDRFREIISDPINLLIDRVPEAGCVADECVYLHNGLRVRVIPPFVYYGDFSQILRFNRGVHEPLEEYVFQEVLHRLPAKPVMVELGAYWAHYSMWLKSKRSDARVIMVEPIEKHLKAGLYNFQLNSLECEIVQASVGHGEFEIDAFLTANKFERLTVLHSDIQGFELEMLEDAQSALRAHRIDYLFISTHSQALHLNCQDYLQQFGYRIEVETDVDSGTTSCDGFLLAVNPELSPVFKDFKPLGRVEITQATPIQMVEYISKELLQSCERNAVSAS